LVTSLWRFEQGSTGGARDAQGFKSGYCRISNQSQDEALDNPTPPLSRDR
jgi:hypothetical protein